MKKNTLLILLAAFAALAGLTYLGKGKGSSRQGAAGAVHRGDKPLAGLDLNAVAKIALQRGTQSTALALRGDQWVVDSLHGYPAQFDTLRGALVKLPDLKVSDVFQDGTSMLDEFGLSTNAVSVEIRAADDKALASLQLGENRRRAGDDSGFGGSDGRYVRAGNGPVLLVDDNLDTLNPDPLSWVNRQILTVATGDVTEAGVSGTNGSFVIRVEAEGKYAMDGLKEDEELDAARCGRLHRGLQYISFEDLADPAKPDAEYGFDKADVYLCKLKNGVTYTALLGKTGDKGRYAKFTAEFTTPPAPTEAEAESLVPPDAAAATNAAANAAAPTNAVPRADRVKAKLAELQAERQRKADEAKAKVEEAENLRKWIFVINTYSAESLAPLRADLVKAKAATNAPPASAAGAVPEAPPSLPGVVPQPGIGAPISVVTEPIAVPPLPEPKQDPGPAVPVPPAPPSPPGLEAPPAPAKPEQPAAPAPEPAKPAAP